MGNHLLSIAENFGVTEAGLMAGTGPAARRKARSAQQKRAMVDCAKLFESAWGGSPYANLMVHEALSTSDLFKSASGDIFDYEMLKQYQAMPKQWDKYSAKTMVKDFRPKRLRDLSGGRRRFERVPELTPYPTTGYAMSEKTIAVAKYGRRFAYSFEAAINDYLNELQQVPGEFGNAAVLTEDYVSLQQLVNPATGAPNTGFFSAGNGNIGTGALTQTNVAAAITTVSTKRDTDGNLLYPGPLQLVVGPALQFQAEALMSQTEVWVTLANTFPQSQTHAPNPLKGKITLTVLDNLPGTAWFVLPLPSAPRPAFYTAFLIGWDTPDLRWKADAGQRDGGGSIAPEEGSFDLDDVQYRGRHIVGAAQGDPMFTWASDGLGS
jgi:hypothetical protein